MITTHTVVGAQGETYNTATALFPGVHGCEWYRTRGFKEIALLQGSVEASYRKTAALINRVRHQPKATPARTLQHTSESEGQQIAATFEQKAAKILQTAGFTADGVPQRATTQYGPKAPYRLAEVAVAEAVAACGADPTWHADLCANPVGYEDPGRTTQITIDDVGVKEQKAARGRTGAPAAVGADRPAPVPAKTSRKYIHNTIMHVQKEETTYTLNGQGTVATLPLLIALLWFNDLLRDNLVFFVDGQRTLHAAITAGFAWFRQIQIILDWYHLQIKCQQQLSLALAGRAVRNPVLEELMKLLWYGLVDRAIAYLRTVPSDQIKNPKAFQTMIEYLERHKGCIPVYAVRKALGLRNSSQIGEKHNDLLVSERQKHNGMSWSPEGSLALASLRAARQNGEAERWLKKGQIRFKLVA